MAAPSRKHSATAADLVARGDYDRLEIIGGEVVEKARPSFVHSISLGRVSGSLHPISRRWWLGAAVHVEYETSELYCHDLAGGASDL